MSTLGADVVRLSAALPNESNRKKLLEIAIRLYGFAEQEDKALALYGTGAALNKCGKYHAASRCLQKSLHMNPIGLGTESKTAADASAGGVQWSGGAAWYRLAQSLVHLGSAASLRAAETAVIVSPQSRRFRAYLDASLNTPRSPLPRSDRDTRQLMENIASAHFVTYLCEEPEMSFDDAIFEFDPGAAAMVEADERTIGSYRDVYVHSFRKALQMVSSSRAVHGVSAAGSVAAHCLVSDAAVHSLQLETSVAAASVGDTIGNLGSGELNHGCLSKSTCAVESSPKSRSRAHTVALVDEDCERQINRTLAGAESEGSFEHAVTAASALRRAAANVTSGHWRFDLLRASLKLYSLVDTQSDREQALLGRGLAHSALGEHEHAVSCFSQCIHLCPANGAAHLSLAHALQCCGNLSAALIAVQNAESLSPVLTDLVQTKRVILGRLDEQQRGGEALDPMRENALQIVKAFFIAYLTESPDMTYKECIHRLDQDKRVQLECGIDEHGEAVTPGSASPAYSYSVRERSLSLEKIDLNVYYEEAYEGSLKELWLNKRREMDREMDHDSADSQREMLEVTQAQMAPSHLASWLSCVQTSLCCGRMSSLLRAYGYARPPEDAPIEMRDMDDDFLPGFSDDFLNDYPEIEDEMEPWSPTSIPMLSPPGSPCRKGYQKVSRTE